MLVSGYHAVEESLRSGTRGSLLVSRNNSRTRSLKHLAAELRIPVRIVAAGQLNSLCNNDRHQGVVLVVEDSRRGHSASLRDALNGLSSTNALIVLLDQLNDPHNLGAILRSADQFAVDLVVTTERRSVSESPGVVRSSSGASRYVPLFPVANLVQAIKLCKENDIWIYGADMDGVSVEQQSFQGRIALILGSEQRGMRRLVRQNCDALIRVPTMGHVDSLNVSVAAGILMYEIRRQQGLSES